MQSAVRKNGSFGVYRIVEKDSPDSVLKCPTVLHHLDSRRSQSEYENKRIFLKKITYFLLIFALFVIINSCSILQPYSVKKIAPSIPEEYREKVVESLDEAGSNKRQLLKVLYHYKDDPLKLEAASFLIAFMPDHCFADVSLVDSLGNIVPLNVMDFNTALEVQTHIDSLEKELGELHYKLIEKRKM